MDLNKIAAQITVAKKLKKKKKKTITEPETEFGCHAVIDFSVDFVGDSDKPKLLKKLKSEIMAALESAIEITANDLRVDASNIAVKPMSLECAVVEGTSEDEDEDY